MAVHRGRSHPHFFGASLGLGTCCGVRAGAAVRSSGTHCNSAPHQRHVVLIIRSLGGDRSRDRAWLSSGRRSWRRARHHHRLSSTVRGDRSPMDRCQPSHPQGRAWTALRHMARLRAVAEGHHRIFDRFLSDSHRHRRRPSFGRTRIRFFCCKRWVRTGGRFSGICCFQMRFQTYSPE